MRNKLIFENKATNMSLRLIGKLENTYYSISGNIGMGCLWIETEQIGRHIESKKTTIKELLKRFEYSNIKEFENALYLKEELCLKEKELNDISNALWKYHHISISDLKEN